MKGDNIKLTVGMAANNSERFISYALESVLRQKDIALEFLIVDDGSHDRTSEIVLSFKDPRIRLIKHSNPKGMAFCP